MDDSVLAAQGSFLHKIRTVLMDSGSKRVKVLFFYKKRGKLRGSSTHDQSCQPEILSKPDTLLSKIQLYYQKRPFYYQKQKYIIKTTFQPFPKPGCSLDQGPSLIALML
ncbi:hypothetical protein I7V34_20685 [Bacillus sp. V3]|nr:hypothetical protein I7V34_20685 [Bacillus sp. V3]